MNPVAELRVLLVEDEEGVRLTLAALLEDEGFEVVEAANGAEALEQLAAHAIDVVLTDVKMPNLDGVGLLQRIREHHPRLPVVLMSAFSAADRLETALRHGAFTIVGKPFDVEEVSALLQRANRGPTVLVADADDRKSKEIAHILDAAGVSHQLASFSHGSGDDLPTIDVLVAAGQVLVHPNDDVVERIRAEHPHTACIAILDAKDDATSVALALAQHGTQLRRPLVDLELLKAIADARRGTLPSTGV